MSKKIGAIFQETNYSLFKRLDGNRSVTALRVKKITDSIKENGYIRNPIIVNEKMEIVDGQGRFESLKSLNMPIDYIVAAGAGYRECIAMNINQSNWKMEDYIQCYAEMGSKDYKYLLCLWQAFKQLGTYPILNAVRRKKILTAKGYSGSDAHIKEGLFKCSDKEYEKANEILTYTMKLYPCINNAITTSTGGRKDLYFLAIAFAYNNPSVDKDRLSEKLSEARDIAPAHTIIQALKEISRIYNYKHRGEKIYLDNDYQRFLDDKGGTR